jgi:hypothetical protein
MIKIYIIKLHMDYNYKIKREKKIIMIINTINKPIFYCTRSYFDYAKQL